MKRMACAIALAAGTGMTGLTALPAFANPSPATVAAGLQVNIVPPGTVAGDATIPLVVKFHGGNIRVVELFIDGARLTRQALSTRDGRGVVHFSLDPTLLAEGSHEVLVKAYEADGTCATTTTQIVVSSGDLNAFARFEWPKRNAEVQGIVPITIKIDPSIMDPYVTYTVDNDFLAFRNYAPYVYNWDTAKVGNGIHSIGIEVMDGRTLQVVQKMTVAINVKNVGGFTKIPPTAAPIVKPETGSIGESILGVAESSLPNGDLAVRDTYLGLARSSTNAPKLRAAVAPSAFRSNARLRNSAGHTVTALPAHLTPLTETILDSTPLAHTMDALRMSMAVVGAPDSNRYNPNPGLAHVAPGLAALAANPRDLMPAEIKSIFVLARQSAHFRRIGAIALRPSTDRRVVRGAVALATAPASLPAFRPSKPKTFDVAFNNSIVNFDVAPRIENGLPLAPFRAIFEHNGGTVKWNNDAKIVRAFDNQHEIEIKIGSKEAKVNNQPISMEATPYLDHGRTIVPLSFVRDAMDLKVTFDQETGHLMIEKK